MSFSRMMLAVGTCAGCLTACQSSQPRSLQTESAIGPSGGEGAPPPSHYRAELLRQAMRGLRYDGGRVEIDEAAAGTVAWRGTFDQAVAEYERARALLRQNQRIQAIAAHTRAVLTAPDQAVLYEGLGTALLAKHKTSEAMAAFRTALDLDRESVAARFNLARALQAVGSFEEAVDELREVIRVEPDHAAAHGRLAILLYYLEDDTGAWAHVRQAESLGSSVPPQFRKLLAQRTPEPRE